MKKKTKKKIQVIRTPKAPAIFFLIFALMGIFSSLGAFILPLLTEEAKYSIEQAISFAFTGISSLAVCIVLFTKKYNNSLIYAMIGLLASNAINTFISQNFMALNIASLIFYVLLIGFTYIMVNNQEAPIRETLTKLRFVLPTYKLVLLMLSLFQTISTLTDVLTQRGEVTETMSNAAVILPTLAFLPTGLLEIICYALLVNWLANPYEKE